MVEAFLWCIPEFRALYKKGWMKYDHQRGDWGEFKRSKNKKNNNSPDLRFKDGCFIFIDEDGKEWIVVKLEIKGWGWLRNNSMFRKNSE